ncbi:SDR family NAD(P)-dependent oxidoreductase [Seohaeicola saemankumensis]|uniref:SDR family NAD(P)-dependent oxidoreductase n=1 Tax=Seohaeicola saemankumensis TaxID=481181 RepID=UPI0035D00444
MDRRNKSVAVIGAGDYIGGAIAKMFAGQGFNVYVGRRNGDRLAPLLSEIEAAGGRANGRSLDARESDDVAAFLAEAEAIAPLDVVIFNVGANVNFPLLDTTDRVFRKVWEMACYSGFVTGREAARIMLPRGTGNIFFTGATAGLRGGAGFAAFASAKFGLRALAESAARELMPQGIHVAHLVIDAAVDTQWVRELVEAAEGPEGLSDPERFMRPAAVAEAYWAIYNQQRDAWTFETQIRPFKERW